MVLLTVYDGRRTKLDSFAFFLLFPETFPRSPKMGHFECDTKAPLHYVTFAGRILAINLGASVIPLVLTWSRA